MKECFLKYLKGKTIILITHALYYLKYTDNIFVIEDGSAHLQGSYNELKQIPQFNDLLNKIKKNYAQDPTTKIQPQNENSFLEKDSLLERKEVLVDNSSTIITENVSLFEETSIKS
jgi:ABC-type multidrug transport system ATPase subunit